jgi:hypothetical protein
MPTFLGTVNKTPSEKIPLAVDFKDVLPTGETIDASTSTVAITDRDGTVTTGTMLQQKSVSGSLLLAIIKLGADQMSYTIKFTAVTANYSFESYIDLNVVA